MSGTTNILEYSKNLRSEAEIESLLQDPCWSLCIPVAALEDLLCKAISLSFSWKDFFKMLQLQYEIDSLEEEIDTYTEYDYLYDMHTEYGWPHPGEDPNKYVYRALSEVKAEFEDFEKTILIPLLEYDHCWIIISKSIWQKVPDCKITTYSTYDLVNSFSISPEQLYLLKDFKFRIINALVILDE